MENNVVHEYAAPSPAAARERKPPKRTAPVRRIAAVMAVAIVGVVLTLPSVRNRLFFDKNYIRIDYGSFKAMVREEEGLSAEEYRGLSESRLAALASDGYDNADYYICREKNPSPFVLPQLYFVADLKKGGVRTEIVYHIPHVPPIQKGAPMRFWATEPSYRSVRIGKTEIPYVFTKNRIECAFIDKTGSYYIHCHSRNAEDLAAVLEDLLNCSIEKDVFH